jgi:predicted TIM-barrel fold metal-dependent hydrolase
MSVLSSTPAEAWAGPVVDADVHAIVPSIKALIPYLEPHWIEFIRETGFQAPKTPEFLYPPGAPTTTRSEWLPGDGRAPASDLSQLRAQVLDAGNVETAIVNCWWGVESIRHPDFGAALARAVNDWLIAEWLDRDPRLRGSMVVPGFDPMAAVTEIDRVGGHSGFVQVFLPVRSSGLYGHRVWHPMFEAMVRHDLVAGIHYGGQPDGPPTPTGWPSWFVEEHAGATQVFHAQLTSLIAEGLFEKFPALRVSLLEGGFTWLPTLMWRLDKEWKGLRRDIPWVRQLPSTTIREHIKLSVRPLDAGPPEDLARVVGWLGTDDILMFSSDYPHLHDEPIAVLLDSMSEPARTKLMADNARAQYRL